MLLPNTTTADTAATAERIRRRIAALSVEVTTAAGPATLDGLTCSIGAATYPHAGNTLEEVLIAADTALYRAKDTGRNCVITSPAAAGPE